MTHQLQIVDSIQMFTWIPEKVHLISFYGMFLQYEFKVLKGWPWSTNNQKSLCGSSTSGHVR